jgi:BirA family biotin operon repressor/biotin-[acetyl-CoA-carboxylase] ligase
VRPAAYPPDVVARATSLEAELGREVDRGLVLAETLAALAGRYADLTAGRFDAILGAWRDLAPSSRGTMVEWTTPDGLRRGRTEGIDDRGALLVRTAAGLERIIAGELTWQ